MANQSDNNLEVTIKFIQSVKDDLEKDSLNRNIPIMPRMDDSYFLNENEQNQILYSFTN